jgi:hypothetical protein
MMSVSKPTRLLFSELPLGARFLRVFDSGVGLVVWRKIARTRFTSVHDGPRPDPRAPDYDDGVTPASQNFEIERVKCERQ